MAFSARQLVSDNVTSSTGGVPLPCAGRHGFSLLPHLVRAAILYVLVWKLVWNKTTIPQPKHRHQSWYNSNLGSITRRSSTEDRHFHPLRIHKLFPSKPSSFRSDEWPIAKVFSAWNPVRIRCFPTRHSPAPL